MKHNSKWKTCFCAAMIMGVTMLVTPASFALAENIVETEDSNTDTQGVETWTAKKEWAYKVIDGHLYKRLYNYSTGCWETDWILVQ